VPFLEAQLQCLTFERAELGDDCVEGLLGPAVGDALWGRIEVLEAELRNLRWDATINLFDTASNARCERYCSRMHESGAERTGAFTMLDWSESDCPSCGGRHKEVAYAYPPIVLAMHLVNKARQDGGRKVLIVPDR
jgi:hypothetical protein